VGISGDTIVAGAPGLEGVPPFPGGAYVFTRPAGGWADATQTAKLTASDGAAGDFLGTSVAVEGDTIVAGAPGDDVGSNVDQGSAYVFARSGSDWVSGTQAAQLTASDGAAGDSFGWSVALAGSRIVVGAPNDDVGAQADQGSAYVFERSGAAWANATQTAELHHAASAVGEDPFDDQLGFSVAVLGDTVVAGAPRVELNSGAAYVFELDTTPPETMITSGPSGLTNSATSVFEFSSEPGAGFACRFDSDAFAPCTSPHTTGGLSQGAHTFEVRATDAAGNVDGSPASRSFTVDTVAPDTTIDSGPSGVTKSAMATFGFSSEAGATFECRVDSDAFALCTSPHTTAALTDGAHTFQVRATDAAGNTGSPASRSFTVDTVAPDTTITSGPSGVTSNAAPSFGFSSEAGAVFACRVDSAAFASCTSPHTTATLTDGAHTFQVRATDAAGNTGSPASRSFTVQTVVPDTTAPLVRCSATPSMIKGTTLKSNNHKLISVSTSVTVIDNAGGSGSAGFKLVSVTSSQADRGLASDDLAGDIQGWVTNTADTSGLLRQERYGVDRVYTLTYRGADNAGNTATCSATVTIQK
jgi:hypothetical protein